MDAPAAAAIRTVSGAGARIDTRARPRLGHAIELRHPDAGAILGTVDAHLADGIALRFDRDAHAVAFAMTAIAADMSRPA